MITKRHSSNTCRGFLFETLETPQTFREESTFLIDLRRRTRFNTRFPGEAFTVSGEHVYVLITNISLSGLRLECCRQAVSPILANLNRRTPDMDPHALLKVHFYIPTDSEHLAPVKVRCRTVYLRHTKNDTSQIGLEIAAFEEGSAAFTQYLSYKGAVR